MRKKRVFKWVGLSSSLLVVLITGLYVIAAKPWLLPPSNQDYFYFDVAVNFSAPELCEKISWRTYTAGLHVQDYVRSQCYENVAAKTGNLLLCDKVKALSKYFAGGFPSQKEQCLENKTPNPLMLMDHRPQYSLSAYMLQLGFPIERIKKNPEMTLSKSDEDLYFDYYTKLQDPKNPEQKEFLEAVRKL